FDGPADNGIHNFALPLTDYWNVQHPASWALALFAVGCVVVGVRQRSPAWLLSGLLVLCFSEPVLEDPANAWRASGMLWLLVSVGPWPRRGRQHSAHSDGQVALGARLPNRPRGFRSL